MRLRDWWGGNRIFLNIFHLTGLTGSTGYDFSDKTCRSGLNRLLLWFSYLK
jgi:hypothetical protein